MMSKRLFAFREIRRTGRHRVLVLLAAAIIGIAQAIVAPTNAIADQTDHRLDNLFKTLRTTNSPARAAAAEAHIWTIWQLSEDDDIRRLMQEAGAAMGQGRLAEADGICDRIVEMAPRFAEGWNRRATVRYMRGDHVGSLADIRRTLALEPRHFGALSGMGLVLIELERESDALRAFEEALVVNPHMPGAEANRDMLRARLKERNI